MVSRPDKMSHDDYSRSLVAVDPLFVVVVVVVFFFNLLQVISH